MPARPGSASDQRYCEFAAMTIAPVAGALHQPSGMSPSPSGPLPSKAGTYSQSVGTLPGSMIGPDSTPRRPQDEHRPASREHPSRSKHPAPGQSHGQRSDATRPDWVSLRSSKPERHMCNGTWPLSDPVRAEPAPGSVTPFIVRFCRGAGTASSPARLSRARPAARFPAGDGPARCVDHADASRVPFL